LRPKGLPRTRMEKSDAPKGNGGRHCCQPPLRRAKDMPVFVTWSKPEGPDPLSILAHQLRRRFLSNSSPLRGARPVYQTARPEGSLVLRPVRPALNPIRKPTSRRKPSDVPRPFLGRSLYRLALSFHPRASEPRRARGKINSSGASSRLARRTSEEFRIACRRRSVLPSPSASFWPLRAFRWRRGLPSRSPFDNAPRRRVGEAKFACSSLWITGILGTTLGTF
jgi:hypothetical protein